VEGDDENKVETASIVS